jgi:SAM-dependent methyltransferase
MSHSQLVIKHLNIYSAYSLLNKNVIITYKIDGIPIHMDNHYIERVNGNNYPFPKNFDLQNFFTYTGTNIIDIRKHDYKSTYYLITHDRNMISKRYENTVIKNFFLINTKNIFDLLQLLKQNYDSAFPNDGFMIYNLDSKQIHKLKPLKHMTIDLRKEGSFFYSNDRKIENINIQSNNQEDGIYRIYPINKSGQLWKIGEKRIDKNQSNPLWLVNEIINLIKNDFDYRLLNNIKRNDYYNHYNVDTQIQMFLQKRKLRLLAFLNSTLNNSSKILDFGCGFGNYMNDMHFKYYLGIDKDLQVLESINKKKKCNPLWLDFSNDLNISTQISIFGDLWKKTQNKNYNKLKNDYSLIIFNHSFHNVKNLKKILNFIKNNYNNALVYIATFDITQSFTNKYQKLIILNETDKKIKVNFFNSWINKELIEEYYKIAYLESMLNKYQINYKLDIYNPSILY